MSITPGLSMHERAVWMVLRDRTERLGYCPSQKEVAETTNFPKATVNRCVRSLELKGYIRRLPGVARSIIPVDPEHVEASRVANHVRAQIAHLRNQLKSHSDPDVLIRITDQIDNLLYKLEKWGQ